MKYIRRFLGLTSSPEQPQVNKPAAKAPPSTSAATLPSETQQQIYTPISPRTINEANKKIQDLTDIAREARGATITNLQVAYTDATRLKAGLSNSLIATQNTQSSKGIEQLKEAITSVTKLIDQIRTYAKERDVKLQEVAISQPREQTAEEKERARAERRVNALEQSRAFTPEQISAERAALNNPKPAPAQAPTKLSPPTEAPPPIPPMQQAPQPTAAPARATTPPPLPPRTQVNAPQPPAKKPVQSELPLTPPPSYEEAVRGGATPPPMTPPPTPPRAQPNVGTAPAASPSRAPERSKSQEELLNPATLKQKTNSMEERINSAQRESGGGFINGDKLKSAYEEALQMKADAAKLPETLSSKPQREANRLIEWAEIKANAIGYKLPTPQAQQEQPRAARQSTEGQKSWQDTVRPPQTPAVPNKGDDIARR